MWDTIRIIIGDRGIQNTAAYNPYINTFSDLMSMILNGLIGFSFSLGFVMLSYTMFMYVTSAGNPEKTGKAWSSFVYGIIGILVAFATMTLKRIILGLIGITDPLLVEPVPNI